MKKEVYASFYVKKKCVHKNCESNSLPNKKMPCFSNYEEIEKIIIQEVKDPNLTIK